MYYHLFETIDLSVIFHFTLNESFHLNSDLHIFLYNANMELKT